MFALPFMSMIFGKAKWLLLAAVLALAAWGYWSWSRAEMAALRSDLALVQKQADDLKLANDHILADLALVRREQDRAEKSMQGARARAQQASRAVRQPGLAAAATVRPREVQGQINNDMATTFKGFEDATNAP